MKSRDLFHVLSMFLGTSVLVRSRLTGAGARGLPRRIGKDLASRMPTTSRRPRRVDLGTSIGDAPSLTKFFE